MEGLFYVVLVFLGDHNRNQMYLHPQVYITMIDAEACMVILGGHRAKF